MKVIELVSVVVRPQGASGQSFMIAGYLHPLSRSHIALLTHQVLPKDPPGLATARTFYRLNRYLFRKANITSLLILKIMIPLIQ